jgi:Putative bacterial sensory transduction regulator
MTQNCLTFILPIVAIFTPVAPAWGQETATVAEETPAPTPPKGDIRYIKSSADLAEVLRFNGLEFKKQTLDGQDFLIVDVDGITTVINFHGTESELESMTLYAGFTASSSSTVQRMNEWNSTHRFTRAYIDEEGDPVLEMDLNFTFGGVSERQLEDSLALWESSITMFRTFIYGKDGADERTKSLLKKIGDI